jgi:hypothetical protein
MAESQSGGGTFTNQGGGVKKMRQSPTQGPGKSGSTDFDSANKSTRGRGTAPVRPRNVLAPSPTDREMQKQDESTN